MKTPYIPNKKKFDMKILLVGNSGSGKTELASSYTKGPVHFYMADKGGEKTIEKNLPKRSKSAGPISIDKLSSNTTLFSDFWTTFQQDDKDGFFQEMAEKNGLVVFDSLSALNNKALTEVKKLNRVAPLNIGKAHNQKLAMGTALWGQLLSWITSFVSCVQELPCAVIVTAHLHVLMGKDQDVVARYPHVNGQFRQLIGVDFDETYLLETKGSRYITHFKECNKFEAKSRMLSQTKQENLTMDQIASAYMGDLETIK